jgi:hypothetical protein
LFFMIKNLCTFLHLLLLLCFALLFLVACMHVSQESESKALQSH